MIYSENINEPNIDPWGTPQRIFLFVDTYLLQWYIVLYLQGSFTYTLVAFHVSQSNVAASTAELNGQLYQRLWTNQGIGHM